MPKGECLFSPFLGQEVHFSVSSFINSKEGHLHTVSPINDLPDNVIKSLEIFPLNFPHSLNWIFLNHHLPDPKSSMLVSQLITWLGSYDSPPFWILLGLLRLNDLPFPTTAEYLGFFFVLGGVGCLLLGASFSPGFILFLLYSCFQRISHPFDYFLLPNIILLVFHLKKVAC